MTDAVEGALKDIAAVLLEPLEEADRLVGEAIDKIGEGTELAGAELGEVSATVESLATRIEALQQRLRGGQ